MRGTNITKSLCFYGEKDEQYCDSMDLIFWTGRMDGDIKRMSRKDLINEVKRSRKIDMSKSYLWLLVFTVCLRFIRTKNNHFETLSM